MFPPSHTTQYQLDRLSAPLSAALRRRRSGANSDSDTTSSTSAHSGPRGTGCKLHYSPLHGFIFFTFLETTQSRFIRATDRFMMVFVTCDSCSIKKVKVTVSDGRMLHAHAFGSDEQMNVNVNKLLKFLIAAHEGQVKDGELQREISRY